LACRCCWPVCLCGTFGRPFDARGCVQLWYVRFWSFLFTRWPCVRCRRWCARCAVRVSCTPCAGCVAEVCWVLLVLYVVRSFCCVVLEASLLKLTPFPFTARVRERACVVPCRFPLNWGFAVKTKWHGVCMCAIITHWHSIRIETASNRVARGSERSNSQFRQN
jgi:hypothetical protein